MLRHVQRPLVAAALIAALKVPVHAGVVNPDISVVGQPVARWSDDPADASRKRVTLAVGETEVTFDAPLNPYARGLFTLALGDEGIELEEGYFVLTRGLPAGLALKGGKYRAGFGKLNPVHPHAYPFADRFRVLAAYLPGEESFNDVGVQLSRLTPLVGDAALTASVDWLQGDSFRIPRQPSAAVDDPLLLDPVNGDLQSEARPAVLGRLSAFLPVRDPSGVEVGVSATHGTNNVAAGTRTTLMGADLKAKLWTGPRSTLLVQGEVLRLRREEAGWDGVAAAYTRSTVQPFGGYVSADYSFDPRYSVGASYERFQQPTADKTWDHAFGVFAGVLLLEESTAFRLGWERAMPGTPSGALADPEAVNTITLRVVYSMGPHKAHVF